MIYNIHFTIRVFLCATLFLFISSCQKHLVRPQSSIQLELEKSIDQGIDGIIVYTNQAGKSAHYSAGWKNRENKILADPHALFKIASISKLYIAAATTKLIATQKLSLEETLQQLIPETGGKIEHADEITLKMMLQHRSGIPDFIYHPDFENSDPNEDYMTTAALMFGESAKFKPDKKYEYSNTNYLLIGEILDRTLGYTHHTYIKNEILSPLGLRNTFSLMSEIDTIQLMSGYLKGHDPDLKSENHTRPGGSMIATAEDVGTFLRALIDGTLFTPEEQVIYSEVYKYEHTGWLHGYTSIARYNSDIDTIVIQFVSTSHNGMFWLKLEGLYERINKILLKQN